MVYPMHPNLQVSQSTRAAARASRRPSPAQTAWAAAVWVLVTVFGPVALWLCRTFPVLAEDWERVDGEEFE